MVIKVIKDRAIKVMMVLGLRDIKATMASREIKAYSAPDHREHRALRELLVHPWYMYIIRAPHCQYGPLTTHM